MKNKKLILLLLIFIFCVLYLGAKSTLAALESRISPKIDVKLGQFKVKVNDKNIVGNDDVITLVGNSTDVEHVRDGKAAPGSSVVYDVYVDTTGSEVAVAFKFIIDDRTKTPTKAYTFKNVVGDITLVKTGDLEYTGVINKDAHGKKHFVITFDWLDEEIDISENGEINTDIDIDFKAYQYKGEEIIAIP